MKSVDMSSHPTHTQNDRNAVDAGRDRAVMLNFGRALDLGDWKPTAAASPTVPGQFREADRPAGGARRRRLWTRFAEVILSPREAASSVYQFLGDHRWRSGDRGQCYKVARHWKPTDGGSAEYTQNGWYENSFARIDGHWKITRLLHTYQWVSGNGGYSISPIRTRQDHGSGIRAENRVNR